MHRTHNCGEREKKVSSGEVEDLWEGGKNSKIIKDVCFESKVGPIGSKLNKF